MSANEIDYERTQLRNWYLALLRQRAIAEASQFVARTPGALMAADVQKVQSLILSRSELLEPSLRSTQPIFNNVWLCIFATGIVCCAGLALWILMQQHDPFTMPLTVASAAFAGLFFIAIAGNIQSQHSIARALAAALARTRPDEQPRPSQSPLDLLPSLLSELAKLKEAQNLIADYPGEVVCTFDESLEFHAVSPSSNHVLNLHHSEMMGHSIGEFIQDASVQSIKAQFEQERKKAVAFTFSAQIIGRRERLTDTEWKIEWSNSQSLYFATISDVTVQRELQRTRDEFIAVVSHDLRSPITNVQWTLKLIQNGTYGQLNDTGLARVSSANYTIEFLLLLVSDIIDLYKFDTTGPALSFASTDCRKLVLDSIETIGAVANARAITFDHRLVESVNATVDPVRMTRVLINLLSNAVKFSPKNSVITVAASISSSSLVISIADQGPGIAAESRSKLFSRFGHIDAESTRKDGSGLGLYASKAIVEAHGGSLSFEPVDPTGSKFVVELPLEQGEPSSDFDDSSLDAAQ
jgi:signal transduction histidine kinase